MSGSAPAPSSPSGSRKSSQQAVSPADAASIPSADAWWSMENAPRDGTNVILCLGECYPDLAYVRTGGFIIGKDAEELGYREFAKYGGWLIPDENYESWYVVDFDTPRGWRPMPDIFLGAWRSPTKAELDRAVRRANRLAKSLTASGTDAQSGETAGLDPQDDGPVPQGDAQPPQGDPK